jgi:hypothetical protein
LSFALLGTFIGFAIDFGHAYLEKARVSRLVDGAALAAAKALKGQSGFEDEATRAACDSMVMNGAPVVMTGPLSCETTTGAPLKVALSFFDVPVAGGPPIKHVSVTGAEPVSTTFLRFLGWMVPDTSPTNVCDMMVLPGDYSKIGVCARAEAAPERPIDLMLVLDRSGSMGPVGGTDGAGNLKITSLKIAVNAFLGLSNTFSSDDRIGMVSFATRGCGDASGLDSTATNCTPDMALDYTTSSYITALQNKVNGLCNGGTNCSGGTNTMEALRVARPPLATAFDDPTRATTRKAVLLVTDGQPTFMRRNSDSECRRNPLNGNLLPDPNGNTAAGAGGPTFSNGCKQGVPSYTSSSANPWMYRARLSSATCYVMIPGTWTSTNCPGSQTPNNDAQLYKDVIRCTRSMTGCVTNGAMFEANEIRNCGFNNASCGGGGAHDIVFFAIAIGKVDNDQPQSSMDKNAKCLLARMANAEQIVTTATGVIETLTSVCTGQIITLDGDTHADLNQGWPAACGTPPCIDSTQEKGRVYIIDTNGNVQTQLQSVFDEIAKLLKLRLVI